MRGDRGEGIGYQGKRKSKTSRLEVKVTARPFPSLGAPCGRETAAHRAF